MIDLGSPTSEDAAAAWDSSLEAHLLACLGPLRAWPLPEFCRPPDRRSRAGYLPLAARAHPLAVAGILLSAAVAGPALAAAHGSLLPGIPFRASTPPGSQPGAGPAGETGQPTRLVWIVPKAGSTLAVVHSGEGRAAAGPPSPSGAPSRPAQPIARGGPNGPPARPARRPNPPPGATNRPSTSPAASASTSRSKEARR